MYGYYSYRTYTRSSVPLFLSTVTCSGGIRVASQLSVIPTGVRDRGIVDGSQQIRDLPEIQRILFISGIFIN